MLKLKRNLIMKSSKLLDMEYKTSELAAVLEVNSDYLRKQIIRGLNAPHRKDAAGHIWINGQKFHQWIQTYQKEFNSVKSAKKMADREFYCVSCRKRVIPDDFTIGLNAKNVFRVAQCPECGREIRKYLKNAHVVQAQA